MTRALIFDCDGVLADTERDGHLAAFNQMWREQGVDWQWSLAQYAYEYMVLSIPMIKVYACETEAEPPCDEAMLDYLDRAEPTEDHTDHPLRDAFKGWKQEDN